MAIFRHICWELACLCYFVWSHYWGRCRKYYLKQEVWNSLCSWFITFYYWDWFCQSWLIEYKRYKLQYDAPSSFYSRLTDIISASRLLNTQPYISYIEASKQGYIIWLTYRHACTEHYTTTSQRNLPNATDNQLHEGEVYGNFQPSWTFSPNALPLVCLDFRLRAWSQPALPHLLPTNQLRANNQFKERHIKSSRHWVLAVVPGQHLNKHHS